MKSNPALFFTIIVSLGGFIFGFDASVISGTLGLVSTEFGLTPWQQGWIVGAPTLGGILATFLAGYVCDAIGRRNTLMMIALLYLVSAIFSAFSPTFMFLVVARFIGGLAFCCLMIAPMYIAEISPAKSRGKMVSINQLNIVFGLSAAYFANYYVLQISHVDAQWVKDFGLAEHTWRWMLGLEIVPAFIYFILLFAIPKSPRWLVVKGREAESREVLQRLHPDYSAAQIDAALQDIKDNTEVASPLKQRLKELFGPALRFAVMIGLIVGIAQQLSGVNAIYFYAPSIFEQSGVGTDAAFSQAIWVGLINIAFTIVAMLLIDRLGRKPLLIGGLVGVIVSMSICAFGYYQASYQLSADSLVHLQSVLGHNQLGSLQNVIFNNDVDFKNAVINVLGEQQFQSNQGAIIQAAAELNASLILFGILAFVASFAFSLGPVMWVLFSEIFPNHIRGLAVSLVGVINSLVSFIVQVVFPWELATMGASFTFAMYAAFAFVSLLLVWKKLPETKGKSLEELEQELAVHATPKEAL